VGTSRLAARCGLGMSNFRSAVNNQREPLWQTVLQPDLILQIEQILQETDLMLAG